MSDKHGLCTRLVHAGEIRPPILGAVVMPIFATSTYEYRGEEGYESVRYHRLNNSPSQQVLEGKLAAIEEMEAALVSASGMAAIAGTLLSVVRGGDHLLIQEGVYGGTHGLLTGELARLGIRHDFFDSQAPESWEVLLRPKTRAIYVESITNPLLGVCDLPLVARFAREHGLVSIVDNTFATPVNYRPVEHGFDLVVHSGTKYLSGHTDLVCGVVAGRSDLVRKVRSAQNHLGGCLDPYGCFLLHRGLKTLALRVRAQNEGALELARFLDAQPGVTGVNYPGLPEHPQHDRAREWFDGAGGMLSFTLSGGEEAVKRFLSRLSLAIVAPSLGGTETLVSQPALTSHAGLDPTERRGLGIADGLIRVSVGIEDPDDLVEDFNRALS
ncbi:MAG: PLP-dependent transferase [Planctomycetota bacterium]|nr:PLP-dependent transferase [Planctomycetota bacterium]